MFLFFVGTSRELQQKFGLGWITKETGYSDFNKEKILYPAGYHLVDYNLKSKE